ncbi:MAG: hypothetical protein RR585_10020 [Coprobacillus sp.]
MKKRVIYICISIVSFIIMITLLNIKTEDTQDPTSYYYTYYDTSDNTPTIQKKYFTYKQSDYIESFFINCSIYNDQVVSIQTTQDKQPTFVYKNENCWIYDLSNNQFLIKKGVVCYKSDYSEVEKLSKKLKNFSMSNIENIK